MFFAPKFSYVIKCFIFFFHHKQILVSVNIWGPGLLAPVPAGRSGPQLTPSSQGRGEGRRGSYSGSEVIMLEDCWYVVLLTRWWWWRGWPAAATSPRRPAGLWGWCCAGGRCVLFWRQEAGDWGCVGWAAHLEDGERRMPPTPTSSLSSPSSSPGGTLQGTHKYLPHWVKYHKMF